MIVVDTNVITYFMIPGPETSNAESVREIDAKWVAPNLWRSEFRNVLGIQIRHQGLTLSEAQNVMADAERLFDGHEHKVDSSRILELVVNSGCTAYDCEFVAVAETLKLQLVTADKKVLAAFPKVAVSMHDFVRAALRS